ILTLAPTPAGGRRGRPAPGRGGGGGAAGTTNWNSSHNSSGTKRSTSVTEAACKSKAEPTATITQWTEFERGGHFAAMEEPAALTGDIRTFFRALR
ncbi:alpha/beta fold hydrolase, partial [Kitasatospora sp. NPDC059803]|uniref:alpha/beta fold hydrolase n=1 Tax=Kitasatospora sp. NPDC059803 TaxID=3346953 RepID=UPI00366082B8